MWCPGSYHSLTFGRTAGGGAGSLSSLCSRRAWPGLCVPWAQAERPRRPEDSQPQFMLNRFPFSLVCQGARVRPVSHCSLGQP